MSTVINTATATINPQGETTNVARASSKKMTDRLARAEFAAITVPDGATLISRDKDTLTYEKPCPYRAGWVLRTTKGIRWAR